MPVADRVDAIEVEALNLKPPLKWAGGKRWQLPHLRPLWAAHTHRTLVEPFCGGLAVTLGLMPGRAVLNDVNPHLVNFYRWLQKGLRIDWPMENLEAAFYERRERFNAILAKGKSDTKEAAGLFYYLNRTGCRFNSKGGFNVPFGRYKTINYTRDFTPYRAVMAAWSFTLGDMADVEIEAGDFVYADPPYDVEFTQYSQGGFDWDDQQRTAERLARHRGPVVLVNQATERVERLYRELGFTVNYLDAPRRISCTGDRAPAREVIGTRNL
jgi:DNA adenine methylase